jgi:hypothetical protein
VLSPQPGFPQRLDPRQQLRELDPLLHGRLLVPPRAVLGLLLARLR